MEREVTLGTYHQNHRHYSDRLGNRDLDSSLHQSRKIDSQKRTGKSEDWKGAGVPRVERGEERAGKVGMAVGTVAEAGTAVGTVAEEHLEAIPSTARRRNPSSRCLWSTRSKPIH